MKAIKEISREMNGDIETVKYHIIENIEINQDILDYCQEQLDDDCESAYPHGIFNDMEGDLYMITINHFLSNLEYETSNEYIEQEDKDKFNQWISELTKLREYNIYI
jgi:hypothetical protein